jgi:uncharacterized protein (TIGR03663 family)
MARAPEKLIAKSSRKLKANEQTASRGASSAGTKRGLWPLKLEQRRLGSLTIWQILAMAILLVAAILRLYMLTDKVFHHDEGVNGNFMVSLFRNGYYHYDPANYHGPTLYYAALLVSSIASFFVGKDGLNDFTVRLVTVIFGMGVVWLLLCMKKWLGRFGSLVAASLAAVSAGFVFFSRYFIHEILFVFFTLGVIVALLKFSETRRPKYMTLAAMSLGLLGATKETWIITVGVWLIAIPCTWLWMKLRGRTTDNFWSLDLRRTEISRPKLDKEISAPVDVPWSKARLAIVASSVFAATWITFYSSFFTNFPQGLIDSVTTYTFWTRTSEAANVYDWSKYFDWMGRAELPILIFGICGIVSALAKARTRFSVFTAFWAMGVFAAYSLIPYKTPWLALSIILPFVIISGYWFEQLSARRSLTAVLYIVLVIAAIIETRQAIEISFFRYDDTSETYSYAHSNRDFLNLIHEIEKIAAGNPAGKEIGITEMSPEYWPMPWYLRDYTHTGYWGHIEATEEPIIIAHQSQLPQINVKFGDRYRLIGEYDLRPGNKLYLYLRKDLQP